jgi:serine/threonine protein kinase
MSLNSILAQTTTTTTRIVQLDQRLLVSKMYNDARGIRTNEDTAALANSLRNNLLTLRHPNIVTLRRVDASNNNSIHITSDFLENAGDLHNILQTRLRSGVYLNEGEVFRIFIQMALGVKYLHDNGIIMGLLHPRNVLVQQSQSHQQNGGLTVRLTDYGAGHVCGGDIARPPNPRASYRPAPSSEPSLSLASDMWSLGIMLYEMIGLTVPFLGIHLEELERRQLSGIVPPLPSGARVRPQVVDLLGMLLNPNPASRPDINDVLGMPLMQKYVHSLVESMASNSTNSSNSTGRKEVTTHPVPVVPVVRVTRRVKQETEKQKVTSRVDLKDINISVNQAEIILSEEEKQLARLRHAREEAKITAQVEELYAQELAKIEAKPRHQRKYQLPLGFENEGDHIKLRAAESQYIMYGDMTEQVEEEVEADADLMGIEEGEEESTDEKKEEADTLMAGTDTPHATRTPTSQGDAGPQFDDVMSPTWYDEKRERRHAKLGKLRRRGKGPPKKGSGKRSSK